jgi:hypothetical protein
MLDINIVNFITVGIIAVLFQALLKLFSQWTGVAIPFVTA